MIPALVSNHHWSTPAHVFDVLIAQVNIKLFTRLPNLTTFRLISAYTGGHVPTETPDRAEFSLLQSLTLDHFRSGDLHVVFSKVTVPQLTSLTLVTIGDVDFAHAREPWSLLPNLLNLSFSTREYDAVPRVKRFLSRGFWSTRNNPKLSGWWELFDLAPALRSFRLDQIGDDWSSIVFTLRTRALALQTLHIERSDIGPKDLHEIFKFRGLQGKHPIPNIAIRRCPRIPLETKAHLESACQNLQWESLWEADERWKEWGEDNDY